MRFGTQLQLEIHVENVEFLRTDFCTGCFLKTAHDIFMKKLSRKDPNQFFTIIIKNIFNNFFSIFIFYIFFYIFYIFIF